MDGAHERGVGILSIRFALSFPGGQQPSVWAYVRPAPTCVLAHFGILTELSGGEGPGFPGQSAPNIGKVLQSPAPPVRSCMTGLMQTMPGSVPVGVGRARSW